MPDSNQPPPSWPSSPGTASGASPPPPPPPPPPPLPPPSSTDARSSDPWSVPGATDGADRGGPAGWAPPPVPGRRGRRRWVLALAVLLLVVVVGAAVGLVVSTRTVAGDADVGSSSGGSSAPADQGGPRSTETGDLTAAEAEAHRDLFDLIDASERTMIGLDDEMPPTAEGLSEELLGQFRDAAGARAGRLRDLEDELLALDDGGSDAVAAIRDDYASHLRAWIAWTDAVAGDPTLLDRPDAAATYLDAINFTAEGFTAAVANELDRTAVPDDVLRLSDRIIERGFMSSDDGGTEI